MLLGPMEPTPASEQHEAQTWDMMPTQPQDLSGLSHRYPEPSGEQESTHAIQQEWQDLIQDAYLVGALTSRQAKAASTLWVVSVDHWSSYQRSIARDMGVYIGGNVTQPSARLQQWIRGVIGRIQELEDEEHEHEQQHAGPHSTSPHLPVEVDEAFLAPQNVTVAASKPSTRRLTDWLGSKATGEAKEEKTATAATSEATEGTRALQQFLQLKTGTTRHELMEALAKDFRNNSKGLCTRVDRLHEAHQLVQQLLATAKANDLDAPELLQLACMALKADHALATGIQSAKEAVDCNMVLGDTSAPSSYMALVDIRQKKMVATHILERAVSELLDAFAAETPNLGQVTSAQVQRRGQSLHGWRDELLTRRNHFRQHVARYTERVVRHVDAELDTALPDTGVVHAPEPVGQAFFTHTFAFGLVHERLRVHVCEWLWKQEAALQQKVEEAKEALEQVPAWRQLQQAVQAAGGELRLTAVTSLQTAFAQARRVALLRRLDSTTSNGRIPAPGASTSHPDRALRVLQTPAAGVAPPPVPQAGRHPARGRRPHPRQRHPLPHAQRAQEVHRAPPSHWPGPPAPMPPFQRREGGHGRGHGAAAAHGSPATREFYCSHHGLNGSHSTERCFYLQRRAQDGATGGAGRAQGLGRASQPRAGPRRVNMSVVLVTAAGSAATMPASASMDIVKCTLDEGMQDVDLLDAALDTGCGTSLVTRDTVAKYHLRVLELEEAVDLHAFDGAVIPVTQYVEPIVHFPLQHGGTRSLVMPMLVVEHAILPIVFSRTAMAQLQATSVLDNGWVVNATDAWVFPPLPSQERVGWQHEQEVDLPPGDGKDETAWLEQHGRLADRQERRADKRRRSAAQLAGTSRAGPSYAAVVAAAAAASVPLQHQEEQRQCQVARTAAAMVTSSPSVQSQAHDLRQRAHVVDGARHAAQDELGGSDVHPPHVGTPQDLPMEFPQQWPPCPMTQEEEDARVRAAVEKADLPVAQDVQQIRMGPDLAAGQRQELEQLVRQYSDSVFGSPTFPSQALGHVLEFTRHLEDMPTSKPSTRHFSHAENVAIDVALEEMLRLGVVRPLKTLALWVSPLVLVKKSDGTMRACVDFSGLNPYLRVPPVSTMHPRELLSSFAGSRYFSTLDVSKAFWTLPLDARSQLFTAFHHRHQAYHFQVVPFGLRSAPSAWALALSEVVEQVPRKWRRFLVTYADDVVVHTRDYHTHVQVLRSFLSAMARKRLCARLDKTVIAASRVGFLGFFVSERGLDVDNKKVEAIVQLRAPTTRTELRAFLGLCTFYASHVSRFAEKAAALHALCSAKVQFTWGAEEEAAFTELKRSLTQAPTLQMPQHGVRYRVESDSSDVALGGVLLQPASRLGVRTLPGLGEDEMLWRPVAYHSRKLTPAQRNYTVTEKELLALVDCFATWKPYILGEEVEAVVDHQAILWLLTKSDTSARVKRWSLFLSEFPFTVVYRPGKDHVGADALSRLTRVEDDEGQTDVAISTGAALVMTLLHPQVAAPIVTRARGRAAKREARRTARGAQQEVQGAGDSDNGREADGEAARASASPLPPTSSRRRARRGRRSVPETPQDTSLLSAVEDQAQVDPEEEALAVERVVEEVKTGQDEPEVDEPSWFDKAYDLENFDYECRLHEQEYMVTPQDIMLAMQDDEVMWPCVLVLRGKPVQELEREVHARIAAVLPHLFLDDSGDRRTEEDLSRQLLWYQDRVRDPTARLVVPPRMREAVLTALHASPFAAHPGVQRTARLARAQFFWVQMKKDVEDYVRTCSVCAIHKRGDPHRVSRLPITPLPATHGFNERVAIDLVGPLSRSERGSFYIVTMIDHLTKYAAARAVRAKDAFSVAQAFTEGWVQIFSTPRSLVSDNGTEFINSLFKALAKIYGFRHIRTTPYHPQSNGALERWHATLVPALRALASLEPRDWDLFLPHAVLGYNSMVHEATGFAPLYLVTGNEPSSPSDAALSRVVQDVRYRVRLHRPGTVADRVSRGLLALAISREVAHNNLLCYATRRIARAGAVPTYRVGDLVYARVLSRDLLKGHSKKLAPLWAGPYRIIEQGGSPYSYRIGVLPEYPHVKPYSGTLNIDKLKRFIPRGPADLGFLPQDSPYRARHAERAAEVEASAGGDVEETVEESEEDEEDLGGDEAGDASFDV